MKKYVKYDVSIKVVCKNKREDFMRRIKMMSE